MELITAILLFFGMISPDQAQLSSTEYQLSIRENQAVIQYLQARPGEVGKLAGTYNPAIDRAED